jgi:mannitol/fructose-specific phosphotransferase system IIA component (Ntr-type)
MIDFITPPFPSPEATSCGGFALKFFREFLRMHANGIPRLTYHLHCRKRCGECFVSFFAMNLADILSPEQIIPELRATDRWEAIDELIDKLVATGKIKPEHREPITAAVRKRENSMSTGIGFGIGIPHASTDLIGEVVGALGRSGKGVNFDSLDNDPVKLVMLFLVPQGQFQKHLHTLADIAKLLHRKEFRSSLQESPDAATMFQVIKSQTSTKT